MKSSSQLPLAAYLSTRQRLQLHLITLVAVLFLAIYGRLVCPFIDQLRLSNLLFGLMIITFLQFLLREYLYTHIPLFWQVSLPRNGFYLSIISWLLSGIIAMLVHLVLYPEFPWASHIKLMTGYWALGAGLLSQLEYAFFERHLRRSHPQRDMQQVTERLVRRLLESFSTFTLVPALAITLLAFRLRYEGFIDFGVTFEILFLNLSFVSIALLVGWYWGHTLRKDTDHILQGLQKIGAGEFNTLLDASRPDELGQVAQSINGMAEGLTQRERIREAFGRFVSPEVAERFIREHVQEGKIMQMGGERRELAVLMCDLRDFTTLSENLPPEQLTELLNAYFSEMVQAINQHQGMVDKFIGDAIMVVFGMLETPQDCAISALKAALAMREGVAKFNRAQAAAGKPCIENGIGIHVGELVAGYIGCQDRMEFTVIGHTVNLAARIEAQTKAPNPPILFSQAVADRVHSAFKVRNVCRCRLKGVEEEIDLFTVEEGQCIANETFTNANNYL